MPTNNNNYHSFIAHLREFYNFTLNRMGAHNHKWQPYIFPVTNSHKPMVLRHSQHVEDLNTALNHRNKINLFNCLTVSLPLLQILKFFNSSVLDASIPNRFQIEKINFWPLTLNEKKKTKRWNCVIVIGCGSHWKLGRKSNNFSFPFDERMRWKFIWSERQTNK